MQVRNTVGCVILYNWRHDVIEIILIVIEPNEIVDAVELRLWVGNQIVILDKQQTITVVGPKSILNVCPCLPHITARAHKILAATNIRERIAESNSIGVQF